MKTNDMINFRTVWLWVVIFLIQAAFYIPARGAALTRLSISSNHRYLQDKSGKPFLLLGDTPMGLSNKIAVNELDAFYDECKAKGFTILWVCVDGERGNKNTYVNFPPRNKSGQFMMNGPFITPSNRGWDISTLNTEYFTTMDAIVDKANAHGLYLLLMPLSECTWTQDNINKNSPAKWTAYGTFLGNRYKNKANIIWMIGNDFINMPAEHAIVNGIKSTGDTHLITAEWLRRTEPGVATYKDVGSSWIRKYTSPWKETFIDLDAWYQNWPIAESGAPAWWTKVEYQRMTTLAKTMPLFCCENDYQKPYSNATDLACRMQNYYAILGGACGGTLYGAGFLADGRAGDPPENWDYNNYKNNGGRKQAIHFKKLFDAYSTGPRLWTSLIPDYSNTFVTGGKGTLSKTTMDYVGAAVNKAGTLGMAYVPLASKTITVNMSKFSGPVTARWYDPTKGTYQTITGSPFSNLGSHQFKTPAAKHSRLPGDSDPNLEGDWVLVLESATS